MPLKKIIEQNYDSICKRGLIHLETTHSDFIKKFHEELKELEFESKIFDNQGMWFEVADIILVALNYAKHYNIDIEWFLKEKIKINYERAKD